MAQVVIPALAPSLDRSLKGDRSLCPVRALRYYLDRTSDLRQNKELVLVSFKKGCIISVILTPCWKAQVAPLEAMKSHEQAYDQSDSNRFKMGPSH